ncbi:MAG: capsid protein [Circoviridae sp.]|nr:MAG: capsid protein [Circoviridae sp.]
MPRQFSRSRRRGASRRRATSWYNKKYSTMQLAKKAWAATRYLKGLVNSEMLHKDTDITLGAVQSRLLQIVDITQNDLDSGRTGNSLLLKSIYFRGQLTINSSVTSNTRVCLALVKDKQQIADTAPGLGDIFTSSTDPDTLLNLNTQGRFKILWRKTYTLSPVGGGRNCFDITKYWKLYDHVRYNGPASTDIQKNGYYLAVITSEAANFPTIDLNCRVGYHDN